MNAAIIGCGLIGQKRAKALAGAKLVACADAVPERQGRYSPTSLDTHQMQGPVQLIQSLSVGRSQSGCGFIATSQPWPSATITKCSVPQARSRQQKSKLRIGGR